MRLKLILSAAVAITLSILVCLALSAGFRLLVWKMTGHSSEEILINGAVRRYEMVRPEQTQGKPSPLVIVLHGYGNDATLVQQYLGLDAVAAREGFVTVYPRGIHNAWIVLHPATVKDFTRGPDALADIAFIEGLADDLVKRGIADRKRVYLSGISSGGRLAFVLACLDSGRFAAVATAIAPMPKLVADHCKPQHPVPLQMINATADPIFDWKGHAEKSALRSYLSAEQTFDFWRKNNGCKDPLEAAKYPDDKSHVRRMTWNNCIAKTEMLRVDGGGHQTPSIKGGIEGSDLLGQPNHDIETSEEWWKFFSSTEKK